MAQNSKIEWTESTWNCLAGCSIVSTECRECYAMKLAHRLAKMGQAKYQGLTEVRNGNVVWNGTVRLDRTALDIPVKRKKPTLYFVNSMSDMFHESLPEDDVCAIWTQMVVADWHTYQVLTKRPDRARDFVNGWIDHMRADTKAPVRNIWIGTSVGVSAAKRRIDRLRETNAAVRFLSCEPLLEDLGELDLRGIHWVIVGGESGPGARACDVDWVRSIVAQCQATKVPIFVKQLGAHVITNGCSGPGQHWPRSTGKADTHKGHWRKYLVDQKGGDPSEWPEDLRIRQYPGGQP